MLLAFGRFAHDPRRILAAVQRLAGVTIELFLDIDLGFREIIEFAGVCRELCVTSFADAENRNFFGSLHDPEFAPRHNRSLAQSAGRT
jgi:hypothetical protein